ncbi:MAG: RagB/SusD family nutrient uptake outer membrane protein [Cyclobacteriaceae bacterium]
MKKNIISYLMAFIAVISFTSCADDFLDTTSTEDVPESEAVKTTVNMGILVNGMHRLMYTRQENNRRGGYPSMMGMFSWMGEDVVQNARANNYWLGHVQWINHRAADNLDLKHVWNIMYQLIANANIIVEGAPDATGPQEDNDSALGEALCYRAFAHYVLVQLYAERYVPGVVNSQGGVPLRIVSGTDDLARSTVEEVYTQINADLDQAITLLDGYGRANPSHFDLSIAQGLKARVNLTQGNYTVAATNAALARVDYDLMDSTTYMQGINDFTADDWMWGAHYDEIQTSNFTNWGGFMSRNFSSNQLRGNPKSISSELYNTIPSSDVRKAIFSDDGTHPNLPAGVELLSSHNRFPFTHQKFLAAGNGDSRADVPYMRVSEMYLIEAEALARQGGQDAAAAAALLPLAQARDASYTLSANTGQALIDEIMLQRRWELWGEGFRFFDLKRLNQSMDRTGSTNHNEALILTLQVSAGDPRWQWSIPTDELNTNSLVKQNP